MSLVQCDTPIPCQPRAEFSATRLAQRAVPFLGDLLSRLAEARRHRLQQRALDSLPFDLRKDLGWPAGDIHRR
jgi:hypothetical protein